MKSLLLTTLIFLSLLSGVISADESPYDKVNEERVKAEKNYFRARTLVDGLKANKSLSRRIYFSAIKKAEEHVATSVIHLSKSREYLLKGYHKGEIDEPASNALTALLRNLKNDIATLRLSIAELHDSFADKSVKVAVKGLDRAVAVNDFLDWHDFVVKLKQTGTARWSKSSATKSLWEKAAGELGFYGSHIEHLADSVIYANSKARISQEEYDYIKAGMNRFMEFHDQLGALLLKLEAAHNADMRDKRKKAEQLIHPYLSQDVFSAIPIRADIPALPQSLVDGLGYIPSQSMMQAFEALPNRPSLRWLEENKIAMQVFRALYDRGIAQRFLKKFVNLGGRLNVDVTESISDGTSVQLSFGGDLYISKDKYSNAHLDVDPEFLASLAHELFHAYCKQIVENNKDPATKAILVNTESWLATQYVRLESNRSSSRPWSNFSDVIKEPKSFTQDYLGKIIYLATYSHVEIVNQFYAQHRDSRISVDKVNAEWSKAEKQIMTAQFFADQNDDGIEWEVQVVPPDFVLTYLYAFFGLGVF